MTVSSNINNLINAKTIGSKKFKEWSRESNLNKWSLFPQPYYLDVLPRHLFDIKAKSGWLDWQKANRNHAEGNFTQTNEEGTFFSSWGPEYDEINVDLSLASHNKITVDGFGEIRAREDFSESIYDNEFWFYNNQTPGPVIVADPGDTIRVKLTNNLNIDKQTEEWNSTVSRTNLHLHGAHVSPEGKGDNVMIISNSRKPSQWFALDASTSTWLNITVIGRRRCTACIYITG